MVGGSPINHNLAMYYLNMIWNRSSYCNDSLAASAVGNVYQWCWSSNWIDEYASGRFMNFHPFSGAEQLRITFNTATTEQYQVDVYAFAQSLLSIDLGGVKVLSV
jgi:hypothetical protein